MKCPELVNKNKDFSEQRKVEPKWIINYFEE